MTDRRQRLKSEHYARRYRNARNISFIVGGVALVATLGGWVAVTRSAPPALSGLLLLALPLLGMAAAGRAVEHRYRVDCPMCGGECVIALQRQTRDSGYYRFTCRECGQRHRGGRWL